jgi:hypothetical protein
MSKKFQLQDGINVFEENGCIVIENEHKLGSSNRLLVLNSLASQNLLDFLINGEIVSEDHKHELSAVEHLRALDRWKCGECGDINENTMKVCGCGAAKSSGQ